MGKATLEVFDEKQAQTIDQLEVGRRISGPIRFALQVPDLKAAMERLLAHGASLAHPRLSLRGATRTFASRTLMGCKSRSTRLKTTHN